MDDYKKISQLWDGIKVANQSGWLAVKTALEKQIPKTPLFSGDGYWNGELVYDIWSCPNCDTLYEMEYDDYEYCPNCGQAIDWSEMKSE